MTNKIIFSVVFSLLLIHAKASKGMEKPEDIQSSKHLTEVLDLGRETFGAVTLSTHLPKLPKSFCNHIISSASQELKEQIALLIDPSTRNQALEADSNLVLYGPSGTGKTTFARVLAQEMDMPFMIVKAGMFANEYVRSAQAGLKRVQEVASKARANVIVDEADCLWRPKKRNGQKQEENEAAEALWQFLDHLEALKLLFIATTNDLKNMPLPLQTRFKMSLYEMQIIKNQLNREAIILAILDGKNVETSKSVIPELTKKTSGFSHREIRKVILHAFKQALYRNKQKPVITRADFIDALKKFKVDTKILNETEWDKKEVFNYIVQSIGAISNVVGIINVILSLKNAQESLRISGLGLNTQKLAISMQTESLQVQKISAQMQAESLECQKGGLDFQARSLALQEAGIKLQEIASALQCKSTALQEKGLSLQEQGLDNQEAGLRYQKFSTNPMAAIGGAIGYGWDGLKWTCRMISTSANGLMNKKTA